MKICVSSPVVRVKRDSYAAMQGSIRMGRWCSALEVIKLTLAVSLGFSLNLFFKLSNDVHSCPPCPKLQDFRRSDVSVPVRAAYHPKTMYEVIRFDYFNNKYIHNNYDDDPRIGLLGHQKADIKDIISQAMSLFNTKRKTQLQFKTLHNGYRRFDPGRGEEYILDLEMYNVKEPKKTAKSEMHRIELVKPFAEAHMVQDMTMTKSTIINFILPITKYNERFITFMTDYENNCLKTKEAVNLLIILVMGKHTKIEVGVDKINKYTTALRYKYRGSHIRVIPTRKPFNRAFAMDLGAKQISNSGLLFFCDIDVTITQQFLTRCRYNTALHKQVYFPGVFSQYDPNLVKKFTPPGKANNLMEINKHTGHWVYYGYGMVCLYKADYMAVGGFDLHIKGWGGEDVDLYKKVIKHGLRVFRAMDPDLLHRFHTKSCDPSLTPDQMRMCMASLAQAIGSTRQLALKMIDEAAKNKMPRKHT